MKVGKIKVYFISGRIENLRILLPMLNQIDLGKKVVTDGLNVQDIIRRIGRENPEPIAGTDIAVAIIKDPGQAGTPGRWTIYIVEFLKIS